MTTLAQMRSRLAEIDERLPLVRSELLTLAEGDLDEVATARFGELETEHQTLADEREPIATRLAAMESVVETARNAQADAESSEDNGVSARSGGLETPGRAVRSRANRLNPFADLDSVRSNALGVSDLRSRAASAIETANLDSFTDDQRELATNLIQRNDQHGRIARHMLLTGSEAYVRAFDKLLGGQQHYQLDQEELEALRYAESHRAGINEGSNTAGGYLVPFMVDPTIVLMNAGSTNPFRQISNVVTISTNTWHGISTAGVSASWLGEAVEATRVDPVFAQPTIPTFKGSAYLQASFEAAQDTNIVSGIGTLLADAKDRLEATAYATGNGTTAPQGIVTGVSAVGGSVVSAAGTGNAYTAADVYALRTALPPRYRSNASWLANEAIYLLTRQFASGTGPQHAFWADLAMDTPSLLLGKPTYESSAMASALVDNAKILAVGDMRAAYTIVDRIGMQVQFNPLVVGGTANAPTGEVGWFATWRGGAGVTNPDAVRLLKTHTA